VQELEYSSVRPAITNLDISSLTSYLYVLMMRNVATPGYRFADPPRRGCPAEPEGFAEPGCIIASPSYQDYAGNVAKIDQDYVYNWTRDAAITAIEIAAANQDSPDGESCQPLIDYVHFARLCHQNAPNNIDRACFTIECQLRQWSDQSDGPALQTVALLRAFPLLDEPTKDVARSLISDNLAWLLTQYQNTTTNLWEDKEGYCLFARAVQLRCFREITANKYGIPVPAKTLEAIDSLAQALDGHWDETAQIYRSVLHPDGSAPPGYDPNTDVVMAAIYGALDPADVRVLATASHIWSQWADPSFTATAYPINAQDSAAGIGPLLGRFPQDTYDGDLMDEDVGHPWPICTSAFAELYYRLANSIENTKTLPWNNESETFFSQVGITRGSGWQESSRALRNAGDRMLKAIVAHSDHLELSEQFDRVTGYEKSVSNLTWSYASFLSAARARTDKANLLT
jgi:glucoamylase